ncbi:SdpI family protein [Anaerosolibacter sp.]|uniref:SdpI family protein n=1 Tax=Anaerosolibacter sp. TaxID=1872527 RepID=UPI0039F0655E
MKINKWLILIILLSAIGTIFVYQQLPSMVPGHWNLNGEVDRYNSKEFVFFTALLPLGLYILMVFLPNLDPKKASYLKHEKAYAMVQTSIVIFLIAIHWLIIIMALGYDVNIGRVIRVGLGLLFVIMGNYMSQIRHNYFFGIKNPWTLASEEVWTKTHRLGGYGFVLSGIIAFLSAFLQDPAAFKMMMIGTFGPLIGVNIYSYLLYQKVKKES